MSSLGCVASATAAEGDETVEFAVHVVGPQARWTRFVDLLQPRHETSDDRWEKDHRCSAVSSVWPAVEAGRFPGP